MKLSPRYSGSSKTALALATILAAATVGAQSIEYAKPADSFVDSIGVNVHLGYNDTAYWNFDGVLKPRLLELGVRHVRGGINSATDAVVTKYQSLAASGIKTNMIINVPANVVSIIQAIPGGISAVEGPNEVDANSSWKYNNVSFPAGLSNFMSDLYSNVNSNAATAHIPVVGPSLIHANNFAALGPVPCDYGNMHSYQAGNVPDEGLYYNMFMVAQSSQEAPIIPTETGYYTLADNVQGISLPVHAKYIPRLFLENFRAGIPRTFTYEFIDSRSPGHAKLNAGNREGNFGLLTVSEPGPNAVVTPKPAFTALKNLIALLKDPGTPFTPGTLDFSISGTDQYRLRHILLQKRDGSFWLVFWQNVKNFTPATYTELNPPDQTVTLTFNQSIGTITTYSPNTSQSSTGSYPGSSTFTLTVSDVPTLVKLSGVGAQNGATTRTCHPASFSAADAFLTSVSPYAIPNNGYGNYYEEGRVGDKMGSSNLEYRQVVKFTLPPLPPGRTVSGAQFSFRLVSKTGTPAHNVNLAVYDSPTPHVVARDWSNDLNQTVFANVLTPSSAVNTTYTVNSASLARAIRDSYASKRGHIAFRFQLPDGIHTTGASGTDDYYRIGSVANDTAICRPALTLSTSPVTTVTVSPASNSDGALVASPTNYNVATTLLATGSTAHIGSHNDDKAYRTFYKFVLPSIPAGTTMSAARLNFKANSYAGAPLKSVVLSSYEPLNAVLGLGDWNDSTHETNLGVVMTTSTPSVTQAVSSWELNQAIRDAYNRPSVNFGFRLELESGAFLGGAAGTNTYYSVGTQDNTTATNRPTLQIDYY